MYKRIVDNSWNFKNANTKQYTHCYHTYPAMMIPQVARRLLREFAPKGQFETLFDPYMGSGTSLVEASILGLKSIGTDLNPLARMISKVKTIHYNYFLLEIKFSEIQIKLFSYSPNQIKNKNFDRISNYSFWYSKDSLFRLSFLQQLINELDYGCDFFNIALSEVVREVSYTRNGEFKRYKMTKYSLEKFKPDVFALFEKKVLRNLAGLKEYNSVCNNENSFVYNFNTSIHIPNSILQKDSVDIVITSPPYGDSKTTVAYGQFSRWANEWFNFPNAKKIDNMLMGGNKSTIELFKTDTIRDELTIIKKEDKKRYYEVISFLNDYYMSLQNISPLVRKGGVVCYVVGNRRVKNVQIDLDYFTAETFEKCGFKHLITLVREIPNKRMPSKTSPSNIKGDNITTINREYIVIMRK